MTIQSCMSFEEKSGQQSNLDGDDEAGASPAWPARPARGARPARVEPGEPQEWQCRGIDRVRLRQACQARKRHVDTQRKNQERIQRDADSARREVIGLRCGGANLARELPELVAG